MDATLFAQMFAANFLALVCFGCAILVLRRWLWIDADDKGGFRLFLALLLGFPTITSVVVLYHTIG